MKKFLLILVFLFILIDFNFLFTNKVITGGDLTYVYSSMFYNRPLWPMAWNFFDLNGLGGFAPPLQAINTAYAIPTYVFGILLNLSWTNIERFSLLIPLLILTVASSFILFKKLFNTAFSFLASIIFVSNTYFLMLVGGGQVFIGLSYALSPLVLYSFIKCQEISIKRSVLFGILLSAQLLLDIRVAYITLVATGLYWLVTAIEKKKVRYFIKSMVYMFIIPGFTTFLLHAFWLLPTVIYHQNPLTQLGTAYTSTGAVQYFSFAKFENTISLLHPNWPENIFGKVYFMRPEFLLLPIFAYGSLLFAAKIKDSRLKTYVIYFALLGLVGAFLAKGANDPFGGIYLWMFDHVPGFVMFRDSTKWYTLVAISYSVLIPFTVWKVYEWLKTDLRFKMYDLKFLTRNKVFNIQNLFVFIVICYLLFLIRPALLGQLTGTFKPTTIPPEYNKLGQFLSTQSSFSRTLWVPTTQRFGYYTDLHPEISGQDLFNSYNEQALVKKLAVSEKLLQEASVKYVIVPFDSEGEIFLNDRKYDNVLYQKTVADVAKIKYLKEVYGFGRIAVFEVPTPKGHFYLNDQSSTINFQFISPVEYKLSIQNARKGDRLVFAESFDKNWELTIEHFSVGSSEFDQRFNSFLLPDGGSYSATVYYTPQKYVDIGLVVSGVSLLTVLGYLIFVYRDKLRLKK